MKLLELKARVDHALKMVGNEELEVVIPNNKGGMSGCISATGIKSAGQGIDWNHRKFIIWPEVGMVEFEKKM